MSFRTAGDAQLVQQFFKLFYERNYVNPFIPSKMEKREFGYTPFGQKIMVRHLSFRNFDELHKTLVKEAPLHVYRSAAIYQYPEAPMEEKGWLGAELIFDIDADHLNTSCKQTHDYFICVSCSTRFSDKTSKCQQCGREVLEVSLVCETCLNTTKQEMMKLIDFMENDIGLNEFTLSFSGNRGYHLAIPADDVLELERAARQEIVDYVTGNTMDFRMHGLLTGFDNSSPGYSDPGWRGRATREIKNILLRLVEQDNLVIEKIGKSLTPRYLKNLQTVAAYWSTQPRWDLIQRPQDFAHFVALAVENLAAHIDTVVTTDVHRLLRLADTLNGKTGLKAAIIDPNDLESFDPLTDTVVLPEEPMLKVKIIHSPRITLKQTQYGPFTHEVVKLPAYAAVFFACKGLATTINE
ncbi:MAG: DNA primase small subunit PriS [Candidatus Caldarchaeum sp.]